MDLTIFPFDTDFRSTEALAGNCFISVRYVHTLGLRRPACYTTDSVGKHTHLVRMVGVKREERKLNAELFCHTVMKNSYRSLQQHM